MHHGEPCLATAGVHGGVSAYIDVANDKNSRLNEHAQMTRDFPGN